MMQIASKLADIYTSPPASALRFSHHNSHVGSLIGHCKSSKLESCFQLLTIKELGIDRHLLAGCFAYVEALPEVRRIRHCAKNASPCWCVWISIDEVHSCLWSYFSAPPISVGDEEQLFSSKALKAWKIFPCTTFGVLPSSECSIYPSCICDVFPQSKTTVYV